MSAPKGTEGGGTAAAGGDGFAGGFVPELNYRPLNALDPFAGTRFSFPGAFTIPLAGPDLAGPDLAGPSVAGNEGPAVDATI